MENSKSVSNTPTCEIQKLQQQLEQELNLSKPLSTDPSGRSAPNGWLQTSAPLHLGSVGMVSLTHPRYRRVCVKAYEKHKKTQKT